MGTCEYLKECQFVVTYVDKVKPHWDDFVKHYCHGTFQDICQRKKWFEKYQTMPSAELMPTGYNVPERTMVINNETDSNNDS
jgi:hypothetical protein